MVSPRTARTDLVKRCIALYIKNNPYQGQVPIGRVTEHHGITYVRLDKPNTIKPLAVYALDTKGALVRRKTWPREVGPPSG